MTERADCPVDAERVPGKELHSPATGPAWLIVANPVAGRPGPYGRAWRDIDGALRTANVACDVQWTSAPGDGARIAAAAWRAGIEHFLVAGGDGSLHDVVNGLLREREAAPGDDARRIPTVVPLPLGTGNDWARSLALPRRPAALAALVRRNASVLHDAGRIDFLDATGAIHDTQWFINVAGAGFDAHVIERMPARRPSRFMYLWGALRELARYESPEFTLRLDDAPDASDGRLLLAFVANGRFCGGGMHVAPAARLDDGAFDVVTIDEVGLLRALPRLAKLYRGTLLQDPLIRHRLARRVRIDAEPAAGLEADGQFVGRTPAVLTMQAGALRTLRGD